MFQLANISIRPAEVSDAGEIITYLNRVAGESDHLLFGADEFDLSEAQEAAFIEQLNSSEHSRLLVAIREGEIVAVGSIMAATRARIAHCSELALSVSRDCWRQGIGRQLLEHLIAFAKTIP